MDFNLAEDTVILKNNAGRFLKDKCPSSLVKEMAKDEKGFSPSMWKEMAELGWLGLIYDEKYGGLGGSFFDVFILCEAMGKVVLPSPFFCSCLLAGLILQEAGDEKLKESYLAAMAQGEKIMTVALMDERGKVDHRAPKIQATLSSDSSYRIQGTRILVPFAHIADEVLVIAHLEKTTGGTLFKVSRKTGGQTLFPLNTITAEKTFAVIYEDTPLAAEDRLGEVGKGAVYLDRILPRVTVLKCGEMLGGLERVVEMTVEYAKQRHQFGRAIGSLQAIQHYCADMATFLETSRVITYQAASLLSEGVACDKEIAMAKAWTSEAYKKSTWIGHQIHGGIGFTEEHDLHLYFKHAKASELAFGDSLFHRSKIAEQLGL